MRSRTGAQDWRLELGDPRGAGCNQDIGNTRSMVFAPPGRLLSSVPNGGATDLNWGRLLSSVPNKGREGLKVRPQGSGWTGQTAGAEGGIELEFSFAELVESPSPLLGDPVSQVVGAGTLPEKRRAVSRKDLRKVPRGIQMESQLARSLFVDGTPEMGTFGIGCLEAVAGASVLDQTRKELDLRSLGVLDAWIEFLDNNGI